MKKTLQRIAMLTAVALLLCLFGSATVAAGSGTAPTKASALKYDYNGNDAQEIADAVLLLRKLNGLESTPTDEKADVNGDGTVNVSDAVRLMQMLMEDDTLKIVSFNIKHAGLMGLQAVADLLKEVDGDIVGLQEIDCNASRSNRVNQMEQLAKLAGYPYWYFAPVIDLSKSDRTVHAPANLSTNAYGHGVLSKYPIEKSEILWPMAQSADGECRNFERHEINVNGKIVSFYNTHADFTNGRLQYYEVQENNMVKDYYCVCVGDFNETMDELKDYYNNDLFYSFSFGDDMTDPCLRTDSKGNVSQPIDQIIVSRASMDWYVEEVKNGYYVVPHGGVSDHNLVYAYVDLK